MMYFNHFNSTVKTHAQRLVWVCRVTRRRFSLVRIIFVPLLVLLLLCGNTGVIDLFFGWTTPVAEAAYTGKHLRTVEFVLGGGAGTGVAQTGTDNAPGNTNGLSANRASDANVYAGSAWNAVKATAGTKTLTIPGSGIRVLSAYIDFTAQVTSAANVTDIGLALDVSKGAYPNIDAILNPVIENTGNAYIWYSQSGVTQMITAKADASALFQPVTDTDWNAGITVVGRASVKGPTWALATMKLVITYEQNYSLVAHDELKTVRFPLRSTTAGDSGTKRADCAVGTCSFTTTLVLPDLRAYGDVVDAWYEMTYVDNAVASTTFTINGGSAGTQHKAIEAVNDVHEHFIVYRPPIGGTDLSTTTNLQLNVVVAGTNVANLGGEVVVTYKYSTGAAIQTETVQYFIGGETAPPGANASSTYQQTATVMNGGMAPKNIWFKFHAPLQQTITIHSAGRIGASASTSISYAPTISGTDATAVEHFILEMGGATSSWSGSQTNLTFAVSQSSVTGDAPMQVEAFITFTWSGSSGGTVTKTGKYFAGMTPDAQADAGFDVVFPYTVVIPETVTNTLRSSYVRTSFIHSNVTSITAGTIIYRANGSGPTTYTEAADDLDAYRGVIFDSATSTGFDLGSTITRNTFPFVWSAQGNQAANEMTYDLEHVVTYDSDLASDALSVGEGKHLRTVEFVLGSGAGSAATSTTGTDTGIGTARASDVDVYAGSSWNVTKGSAGTKLITIPGSGIRVISAYLDATAQVTSAVNVTDIEMTLDVDKGIAPGVDIGLNPVIENTGNAYIWYSQSGVTQMISAKGNATALFSATRDSDWNAGVNVVGKLSVKGPLWTLGTMKLIITYEQNYSLMAHDELKTVRFPLRSTTAGDSGSKRTDCAVGVCSFTTTLVLPDLATTSDIVDGWFEMTYIDNGVATTTFSIQGGPSAPGHKANEAVNDVHEHFIIYRPRIGGTGNLSTSTNLQLNVTVSGTAVANLGGEVVVTYKFSTGAPTQTETVQYFMGTQNAPPGANASSTYRQTPTVSNGGYTPKNIWFKFHAPLQQTLTVHTRASIGASASTSLSYTPTISGTDATAAEHFILEMGGATTSWSGSATELALTLSQSSATGDAPMQVEAFITFTWSGSLGGTVTQTGKYFAGMSPVAQADAGFDSVFPYTIVIPETVTKTLRSSYVRTAFIHSNVTAITAGTVVYRANASGSTTMSEGADDLDDYRGIIFNLSTSTGFDVGGTISTNYIPMVWAAQGSQAANEMTYDLEHVVTYDANLELLVPIFTQNYFRFYVDNSLLLPTDPWPSGATNIGENVNIGPLNIPPAQGDRIRIRMTAQVATTTLTASSTAFTLQYGAATSTCDNLGATWADVGAISSGALWRGYDNGVTDETNLSTNPPTPGDLLIVSVSDRAGSFEKVNNSKGNPFAVFATEDVEYDWLVQSNTTATNTDYCFRMVQTSGRTPFSFYTNYPTVRTVGYSPATRNWQWFDDITSATPSQFLANENVAPVNVNTGEDQKLRITVAETRGYQGANQKFRLQYSTVSDFSSGATFVAPSTLCNVAWCYADGVDADDGVITARVLTDSTANGRHNEAPTTTSTMYPALSTATEFEFTIKNASAIANMTYFFRLYDVNNDVPVPLDTGESYPSLSTGDTTLTFAVNGVATASTTNEGVVTTITTTPSSVPFGTLADGVSSIGAHSLDVNTNATQGYQVYVMETQGFLSDGGDEIPYFNASNTAPTAWGTGCPATRIGCFGYHAGDDTLFGGSTRFSANDTYAGFETTAREVMYSSTQAMATDTSAIIFRVERHPLLPAGQYQTQMRYIVVPVF